MTVEQSLAGALGCASWRSYYTLREHAAIAPAGTIIRGRKSLRFDRPAVLGLNEVGVTDLVMAAIWRFGPRGAAHAISTGAEANHLGADIAILHNGLSRILLYQAKLASLRDGIFSLKSKVTERQIRLLRKRSVVLRGTRFQVTGRLAVYQADETPFMTRCPRPAMWREPWMWYPGNWHLTEPVITPDPKVGREYYEEMLFGCRCSPSGVLSAPVPRGPQAVSTIRESSTLPWEFYTYGWFRKIGSQAPSDLGDDRWLTGLPGVFDPYMPANADRESDPAAASGTASELAGELAEQLDLPGSRIKLYLITL